MFGGNKAKQLEQQVARLQEQVGAQERALAEKQARLDEELARVAEAERLRVELEARHEAAAARCAEADVRHNELQARNEAERQEAEQRAAELEAGRGAAEELAEARGPRGPRSGGGSTGCGSSSSCSRASLDGGSEPPDRRGPVSKGILVRKGSSSLPDARRCHSSSRICGSIGFGAVPVLYWCTPSMACGDTDTKGETPFGMLPWWPPSISVIT
mmetsp:Transcript_81804/g.265120  ORF Transcript_81804/g.265120 Transcript_81804/m.265120 type:complete len:215 (+) Transcript_81804:119-763(+)